MTDSSPKPPMRPYKKHILVCTGPRCAPETSAAVYQGLKDRLKELSLHDGPERIQRSQAHCFGICQGGPLAVVYPDGVWYHHLTPEKMEKVIQEHLIGDKPVEEFIFHRRPSQQP
ncbi:MAG: (2Fe-2S) ferredoxin domain-containing protein [Candidatus Omnitrophica bacterium]|nr:(2Fe-2S) ferredoxin domain-containing protein [Candidatus Omnitrophota bacterium]